MRKNITKTIPFTLIHSAILEVIENKPVAVDQQPEEWLGTISQEKALDQLKKKHPDKQVMIYKLDHYNRTFECPVTEFLKIAKEKEETR